MAEARFRGGAADQGEARGKRLVSLVLLEDGEVTIIMTWSEKHMLALSDTDHKAQVLADLVVSLLLAITDVDEAEQRLRARKCTAKGIELSDGLDDTASL